MTTPTTEAGHGLPELPEPLISGGNDNSRPDLGRGCTGYTADQVHQYAIDYAAALALSRGVPEGWMRDVADAAAALDKRGDRQMAARLMHLHKDMLAAAPAAAGAQGEVPNVSDVLLKTDDPIQQMRMVVQVARENDSLISRKWVEGWADQWERERRLTTPQPAAADGGVRERARELLAREVDADAAATPGLSIEAERIRNGKTDSAFVDAALRAVSAALSSHRQAGEPWTDEQCREFACVAFRHATHNLPKGVTLEDIRMGASVAMALAEKGAGNG